jgi:hypothetical protein
MRPKNSAPTVRQINNLSTKLKPGKAEQPCPACLFSASCLLIFATLAPIQTCTYSKFTGKTKLKTVFGTHFSSAKEILF